MPVYSQAETVLFPSHTLYPQYIADPSDTVFSSQYNYYADSDIPASGQRRVDLKLGGVFPVYARYTDPEQKTGWQFNLEAGFHGLFDSESALNNLGWNGVYALMFELRRSANVAHRFGFHHISGHIGDEYLVQTGRTRINYTRQDILYGVSWQLQPKFDTYLELGWAYHMGNIAVQEPWRLQLGTQHEWKGNLVEGFNHYFAVHVSSYEENDWSANTSIQLGLLTPERDTQWRFGIEFYDGRSQMVEFFREHERYFGLAFWIRI